MGMACRQGYCIWPHHKKPFLASKHARFHMVQTHAYTMQHTTSTLSFHCPHHCHHCHTNTLHRKQHHTHHHCSSLGTRTRIHTTMGCTRTLQLHAHRVAMHYTRHCNTNHRAPDSTQYHIQPHSYTIYSCVLCNTHMVHIHATIYHP